MSVGGVGTVVKGAVKKGDEEIGFDYSWVKKRQKELEKLYFETLDDEYMKEDYSLGVLLECDGFRPYEEIAKFCLKNNIKRVFDIGCAYAHQSEIFLQSDIDYIGVEATNIKNFWNKDKFTYINAHYPCGLPVEKGDLAVSVYCLTWNCYLFEREKTLREQCEALMKDFEHCLIHVQPENLEIVSEYFNHVHKVWDDLYYFSNKEKKL